MPNVICPCGYSLPAGTPCPCRVKRAKAYDQARGSAAERGYDSDWRKLRDAFLEANPTCAHPGCNKPATEADHIESVADAPHLRLAWSNLRPFCKPHHSARTAREQSFGRRQAPPGSPTFAAGGLDRTGPNFAIPPNWGFQ